MAFSRSLRAAATTTEKRSEKSFLTCIARTHRLDAFVLRGNQEHSLATLCSPEPFGAIALHPTLPVLYAAYDTEHYRGLPGASIAAFTVDEPSQSFVLLSQQALTLSATRPRHISISPDGNTVLVCATGGGAYNSFHAAADGSLPTPPRAIKLTGCGPHPLQLAAQPVFAAFHPSGHHAYACDFGSDRLDHIAFSEGAPSLQSRASISPGCGPCHLSMHPSQRAIAVVSTLQPLLTLIQINAKSGRFGAASQRLIPGAASLSYGMFRASGREFWISGRTQSGANAIFILEADQPQLKLRQTLLTHPCSEQLPLNSHSPLFGRTGEMRASRELTQPIAFNLFD